MAFHSGPRKELLLPPPPPPLRRCRALTSRRRALLQNWDFGCNSFFHMCFRS
jgi:hypothetical protein